MVTGIINNTKDAPTLEEEMAAIVTPNVSKHQYLTKNNCGDAVQKFTEKILCFTVLSQITLRTKQKLITAAFCFNCWTS